MELCNRNPNPKPAPWELAVVKAIEALGCGLRYYPDFTPDADATVGWVTFEVTSTDYAEGMEGFYLIALTVDITVSNVSRIMVGSDCDLIMRNLYILGVLRSVVSIDWSFNIETHVRSATMSLDLFPNPDRKVLDA